MPTTRKGRAINDANPAGLADTLNTYGTAITTALTALNLSLRTVCFSTAGLAEGTGAATFQIATAITYAIDGVRYTKGVTDNIAFTAAAIQATDTNCIYLICIDSAGTLSTVKGTAVATASQASIPAPTAGTCPIGFVHIATSAAATFTAGTTDLGAANVVDTFVNFVGSNPATAVTAATAISTLNSALTAL
jgi:hypothetical protein